MEKSQRFIFSIITAVFNTADYLEDAIESLLAQSIGFEEHVQLILVDDGSTDGSGLKCDTFRARYPNNITVFHQDKRGVSAARNCGLSAAEGLYIGFLDSDDRLSHDTLRNVADFFRLHCGEMDAVSIPIHWFDGKTGEHILNYKYRLGSRIISLEKEPACIQMSISSTFISRRALSKKQLHFDENLGIAEDAKLLQKILLEKRTLGVAADCIYYYRRRKGSNRSTLQCSRGGSRWYEVHMRRFVLDTLEYCKMAAGAVPKFVQYSVLYDIQWRLIELVEKGPPDSLDKMAYKKNLKICLQTVDADIVLSQKSISKAIKLYLLRLKFNCAPQISCQYSNLYLHFPQNITVCEQMPTVTFDFISLKEASLTLEGRVTVPLCHSVPIIFVRWNDRLIRTERVSPASRYYQPKKILDDTLESVIGFRIELPISRENLQYYGTIWCNIGNELFLLRFGSFGIFCPIGAELKNSYYLDGPWTMLFKEDSLCLLQESAIARSLRKIRYLAELWCEGRQGRSAIWLRISAAILKKVVRKPVWLISDRIDHAGDNGEAFFQFLCQKAGHIHLRFLLRKDSVDTARLKQMGTVVDFFSFRHKILHLSCEYILSSHADHYTTNPFGDTWIYYRDLQVRPKFVFLQHGIIKDDLSGWLNRFDKNIYGLVVSTQREQESIINGWYDYSEQNVWLTGLCRYDLLYHNEQRLITIMPTWRKYLMGRFSEKTGMRALNESFFESDYFMFYSSLLTNSRLLNAAKQYGYQICFCPHPLLQPYIDQFPRSNDVHVFPSEKLYKDIFAESELIVTDYSSVAFDFAYLRKPVLYCRPDNQMFTSGMHTYTPGYFSYQDDGFGEVTDDLEETIDQIILYMQNGCLLKAEYRARIDSFFAYHDNNCCLRLWERLEGEV